MSQAAPELAGPTLALVDSPRSPSDCDYSAPRLCPRIGNKEGGRSIYARLRALVRHLAPIIENEARWRLSLFPTPRLEFFVRCISDARCKPHLAALGHKLFGLILAPAPGEGPRGGQLFTRFMLSGFAVYRTLEVAGAAAVEAYPDLQFRLWKNGRMLPPKRVGRFALDQRKTIAQAIAAALQIHGRSLSSAVVKVSWMS